MSESFYSRNSLRHYPLVRESDLPVGLLVDAGFVVDQDGGFVPSQHPVRVDSVARVSGGWTVSVSGPPDGRQLVFFAADGWGEWATVWADGVEAPSGSSSSASPGGVPANWFGFVVLGRESAWQAAVPAGSISPPNARFEPARTAISRGFVRSVRVASRERLRVSTPDCGSASSVQVPPTSQDRPYREWPSTITSGILSLVEGHNLSIRPRPGLLTFSARPGYGAGAVCEEVPVFQGESPPPGSALLTGGPGCGDLVRTLNGLPGRTVLATGGPGVFVTDNPADGVVYFDVDPSFVPPAEASSSSAGG